MHLLRVVFDLSNRTSSTISRPNKENARCASRHVGHFLCKYWAEADKPDALLSIGLIEVSKLLLPTKPVAYSPKDYKHYNHKGNKQDNVYDVQSNQHNITLMDGTLRRDATRPTLSQVRLLLASSVSLLRRH